ncbi:disulfide bond formation protein DsbB [Vibrio sp. SS-MA-C1-2]|uniref:disulfide bond formation protein DsbB n=1 Tax=Vibrio sp. SS-MA-C1-2 TaxID=2908646 RepID=UPI001F1B85C4|nr:disulfide bond formation protein DsbB [Vibrio sp. SS-MA-C1-2]UJF19845.1 disulfide bond formation protein DsbB [Vibrio sp. SS-MA-C1-2]
MAILYYFNTLSKGRAAWLLLSLTALFCELSALFFQHILKLDPCVMCIYERVAMAGLIFSGLIGAIAPYWTRFPALILWLVSSIWGAQLAWEHVGYQFDPSPFNTCDMFVTFPDWLPLNQWMPNIFEATGSCSDIVWNFVGLSMPQWLQIIFSVFIIAAIIVTISQLTSRHSQK